MSDLRLKTYTQNMRPISMDFIIHLKTNQFFELIYKFYSIIVEAVADILYLDASIG